MRRRWLAPCAAVLALCVGSGCAATPKPVVSKAQLGQVVVYKNGDANFERSLAPGEKELTPP